MIPRDYITEWRAEAPWVQDFQVEQDLIISRAMVAVFSHPVLHDALALRGGFIRIGANLALEHPFIPAAWGSTGDAGGARVVRLHERLCPDVVAPRRQRERGHGAEHQRNHGKHHQQAQCGGAQGSLST